MTKPEIRVLRWLAPGYEDAYTQYTIVPYGDNVRGTLWITQVALRDNSARAMQSGEPTRRDGPLAGLRRIVDGLIENRSEDGQAEEVLPSNVGEPLAQAWSKGMNMGTSRAMRYMSDEPNLPLASEDDNPYRGES